MSSINRQKSLLRRFQEGFVRRVHPEAMDDPEQLEQRIKELTYFLDGVLIIEPPFPRATIEKVRLFRPREGDVLLATYPRSGTHWVHSMLVMIQNHENLAEIAQPNTLRKQVQVINGGLANGVHAIDVISQWKGRRCFDTHLLPEHADFPQMIRSSPLKVIYVVRDLKDVIASMYHFIPNTLTNCNFIPFFDEVFEMFKNKQIVFGDWFEHVHKWLDLGRQFSDRFLMVKYEDIIADHAGFIREVAKFCQVELTEDAVMQIVQYSGVSHLKTTFNRANREIVRKGVVGDWENVFTGKALDYFDANLKTKEPYRSLYGTGSSRHNLVVSAKM